MSHSLPAGLRWRAEVRTSAQPQGGGHAKKSEPSTIKRGPTSGTEEAPVDPKQPRPAAPGQEQPNCMSQMWIFVPMLLLLWFLMIRPQQKQEKAHKAMVAALKKGDKVVTNSGMHGTVVRLTDDTVVLKLDQEGRLKITFDRNAVGRTVNGGQDAQSPQKK
jgi:preprotein translocase subunit YajC